ncbi:hypothetical protein CC80DRAFT_536833 [Byssothecium circinans]|uniref:Uncharacterized protein n=1 Tax=Byssothecium circinans TaxID=147558 RepID=A0A6A5TNL2_9PLEO|nr:hypothetical protein CC80DRAFT_536833 [Byssothecium circinans]
MAKNKLRSAALQKAQRGKSSSSTSRADVVTKFKPSEKTSEDGEEIWERTGYVVRLQFNHNADALQSMLAELARHPARPQRTTTMTDPPPPLGAQTSLQALKQPSQVVAATPDATTTEGTATPESTATERTAISKALVGKRTITPKTDPNPKPSAKDHTSTTQTDSRDSTATPKSTIEPRKPVQTLLHFVRQWKDETHDFNMRKVIATLRPADREVEPLSAAYHWFPEAVPVDALFPPGVPMTAKEINAYYPHHIRWKGVMLRLVNNEYRGPEIIAMQSFFRSGSTPAVTGAQINQFLRDQSRQKGIAPFRTTREGNNGKPDRNLSTAHLTPGRYIETKRDGFVVPTFDDLVKGLGYFPTGLDARGLTQCLVWYLNNRDMFSPRLQFNILHTQSLIRVLRLPVKGYGPQNLDMNALEEWKKNGKFAEKKVDDERRRHVVSEPNDHGLKRSRLDVNVGDERVRAHVSLNLRHVLTFPFMAMIGMAAHGVAMGIENAQRRGGVVEELDSEGEEGVATAPYKEEVKVAVQPQVEQIQPEPEPVKQQTVKEYFRSYRIPKRPRVEDGLDLSNARPSKKTAHMAPQNAPSGPRALSQTQHPYHASRVPVDPLHAIAPESWNRSAHPYQHQHQQYVQYPSHRRHDPYSRR